VVIWRIRIKRWLEELTLEEIEEHIAFADELVKGLGGEHGVRVGKAVPIPPVPVETIGYNYKRGEIEYDARKLVYMWYDLLLLCPKLMLEDHVTSSFGHELAHRNKFKGLSPEYREKIDQLMRKFAFRLLNEGWAYRFNPLKREEAEKCRKKYVVKNIEDFHKERRLVDILSDTIRAGNVNFLAGIITFLTDKELKRYFPIGLYEVLREIKARVEVLEKPDDVAWYVPFVEGFLKTLIWKLGLAPLPFVVEM